VLRVRRIECARFKSKRKTDGILRRPERAIAPIAVVREERGFVEVSWLGHIGDSVMAHGYAPTTSAAVLGTEFLVRGADFFLAPREAHRVHAS